MDQMKLTALRDFAIQHFPRAKTVSTSLPAGDYQRTLYGFAALINANAPAIELAAARLLHTVMGLSIDWEDDGKPTPSQRQLIERQAVESATDLCTLTGSTIPWLADALAVPAPLPDPIPAPPPSAPARPALQPGPNQTTEDAARYLGVKAQTMRAWASADTGPLRPIKLGTRNGWSTSELERLAREGWKPGKKAAT